MMSTPASKSRRGTDRSASRSPTEGPARLQKILAAAGLGSRRHCEELITSGRVEVDGQLITELGAKADPALQKIRVDGAALAQPRLVYFLVNKPAGVLSTNWDPSGRMRVIDLVGYSGRLFCVGRLDMSSEGLMLVTNDGPLANRLTHPRYGVEKTYHVEVAGVIDRDALARMRKGVHLAEGFARVISAKVKQQYKHSTLLEIVLAEGRNREIRRILARVGHKVERLKRVALGPLRLGELPSGHVRALDRDELRKLRQAADGARPKRPRVRARRTTRAAPQAAVQARVVIGGEPTPRRLQPAEPRGKRGAGAKRRRRPAKPRSSND